MTEQYRPIKDMRPKLVAPVEISLFQLEANFPSHNGATEGADNRSVASSVAAVKPIDRL